MARNQRRQPASSKRINQLQKRGLDKSEIVSRLTGSRNNSGAASRLTVRELRDIGFSDRFISRAKPGYNPPKRGSQPKQAPSRDPRSGGGRNQGGGGSDPYTDFLREQEEAERLRYNQDAIDSLTALFDSYGLGSLSGHVAQWVNAGMSEAAIVAQLRETNEYKKRFPGMQALKSQGYNAISEAEYLQLEDSYHQALSTAGLPKGFYDSPEDFVKFISNGVDPSEVKARATAAVELANQVDPSQRQLLGSMYGVNTGDLAAYFLDPGKAMPLLQKQLGTVQVANAARKAGIAADFGNAARFERLVDNGIGAEQAAQGYGQIAGELDILDNLADIWGKGDFTLSEAEDATFFGNSAARKKRKGLIDREVAAFSGRSGFDSRVSGRGSTAGSF